MKREIGKYDLIVKDLFQRDHPSLLDELTAGVEVREVLNVELARVEERRADLVLLLADETLLHIEFQTFNDKNMAYREGIYCLLLGQKFRRKVRQVVLYIGQAKMTMDDQVDLGETRVGFRLIDIRNMDARKLIASGKPGDLALALLAGGGTDLLIEILLKANELSGTAREKALSQLVLLSGLRHIGGRVKMELKAMRITADFSDNVIIRDLLRDDRAKILRGQLAAKFGKSLPKWVDEKLAAAKWDQVERWSKKLLRADTLEGVLGKP